MAAASIGSEADKHVPSDLSAEATWVTKPSTATDLSHDELREDSEEAMLQNIGSRESEVSVSGSDENVRLLVPMTKPESTSSFKKLSNVSKPAEFFETHFSLIVGASSDESMTANWVQRKPRSIPETVERRRIMSAFVMPSAEERVVLVRLVSDGTRFAYDLTLDARPTQDGTDLRIAGLRVSPRLIQSGQMAAVQFSVANIGTSGSP